MTIHPVCLHGLHPRFCVRCAAESPEILPAYEEPHHMTPRERRSEVAPPSGQGSNASPAAEGAMPAAILRLLALGLLLAALAFAGEAAAR